MKKMVAILLSLTIVLSLAACGKKTSSAPEASYDTDASGYDYAGDDQKVSDSARIVPSASSTPQSEPTEKTQSDGLRSEFKEAMDAYEVFYQEYCAYMKKLSENPSDWSLLAEYADIMSRADEMNEAFEAWDEDELSGKELEYYLAVNSRVMEMLADFVS